MTNALTALGLAAGLFAAPLAASAATVVPGGTYDVLADAYSFQNTFEIGDSGDTYSFTFENTSTSGAAITLFGGTVEQTTAAFVDGVKFTFGPFAHAVAQGANDAFKTSFQIAAGSSETLLISFGDVVDTGVMGGKTDIDFTLEATAVPIPAGGLLLLSALGGAAALRRRRKAA